MGRRKATLYIKQGNTARRLDKVSPILYAFISSEFDNEEIAIKYNQTNSKKTNLADFEAIDMLVTTNAAREELYKHKLDGQIIYFQNTKQKLVKLL